MTVLPPATGLSDEAAFRLDRLAHRLPVGHLGPAHVGLHFELPQQPVDDDLQVEFAHAFDDGLARFLVHVHSECGVFFAEALQRFAQLVLVRLRLRLDSLSDHGLGELQRLQHDGRIFRAQRIAGARLPQPHRGRDIPGVHRVDLFPVVGVHLQNPPDALLLALASSSTRRNRT